jgi:hypothetical protein
MTPLRLHKRSLIAETRGVNLRVEATIMSYALSPAVERRINEQTEPGHYSSPDDLLLDALAALAKHRGNRGRDCGYGNRARAAA